MQERNKLFDVAKFLGIFFIWLYHMETAVGPIFYYVGFFHIQFFFFIAGAMDNYDKEPSYLKYVGKNVKNILLPYAFFVTISMIYQKVSKNFDQGHLKFWIKAAINGGTRETFFAYSLWFLTAIFVMKIVFKLLKLIPEKSLILLITVIIYYVTSIHRYNPVLKGLPWNIFWVAFFIVFYAIGYVAYPYLINFFKLDTFLKKVIFIVTAVATAWYGLNLLWGNDFFGIYGNEDSGVNIVIYSTVELIRTLILIWLNLCLAKILEEVRIFNEIGRETLWLCGNEFLIKNLFMQICYSYNINYEYPNFMVRWVSVYILLYFTVKVIIPAEKNIYGSIVRVFSR